MTRVKICGITNEKDAEDALRLGADALGFVFAPSPRRVSPGLARKICRLAGPWTATVGVFVNAKAGEVKRLASECGLTAVQLHGDEKPAYLKTLGALKIIKAFRVENDFDLSHTEDYAADAYLFDAHAPGARGGTGKTFNWDLLKGAKVGRPLILSGGLNPANVEAAVKLLHPYGVDVSSGVESSPGKKDRRKLKEFIKNAKAA
jgi:phosphoribosylanthranilate isomerase